MSDSWIGGATDWFGTVAGWSSLTVTGQKHPTTIHTPPTISSTGNESVIISGTVTDQPTISPNAAGAVGITVNETLTTGGSSVGPLSETQIDGELITLSAGADLTIQGIALGNFYGTAGLTAANGTLTGLHGALSATPTYDTHMVISATGTDTLTVETVNQNFGLIEAVGAGNTLNIANDIGANPQALHGLVNFGLISIGTGAEINIGQDAAQGTTFANFYNSGWIVDNGGTLDITSSVLDGVTVASTGAADGYIEIGNSGDVILAGTVAAREQVDFTDTLSNTLQISSGTLFSGTVNNFGGNDTIIVTGFTSSSNATLVTVGTISEIVTKNGNVATTIKLTGSISDVLTTGTNASGQEFIESGATSFSTGSSTLGSAGGTEGTVANNGTITVSGSATTLSVYDSITGNGAYLIDFGGTLALDNATGNDAGQSVIFGTHGSAGALNTFIVNDNTTGFGGHVTGFGINDVIDLGGSVLPALTSGEGVELGYTGGVLTVTETNAAGASVASTTLQLTGTAALSTASFVALLGTAGVEVELASTQAGKTYDFTDAAGTHNFSAPNDYTGGIAPGNDIAAGETVSIVSGTASVSSGPIIDNGTIVVGSVFADPGILTGTGTLAVLAGGHASLTGGASLGSITDAGTLTLAGSFAAPISLSSGAGVTISGNFIDSSAIGGPGTLTVDTGVSATLAAGSSFAAVNNFGTIDLLGSLATPIDMEGNNAKSLAEIDGPDLAGGTLQTGFTDFGRSDQIILGASNFSLSGTGDHITDSYSNGILVVTDSTSGAVVTLDIGLASSVTGANFSLSTAGGVLDISIPCYASGTRILTEAGDVLVENLAVGDTVVTVRDGGPATAKIVWTGRRSIDIKRHPQPALVLPVRISAGAFAPGVPERDLRLSPHHAVYVDGCLFEAISLVNNVTIVQEQATPHVTYHHIELESHDVMLAEGLPAESFLDTGNRDMFEHTVNPMALHADFRPLHDAKFCAPMIREGSQLAAVRAQLQARADATALVQAA